MWSQNAEQHLEDEEEGGGRDVDGTCQVALLLEGTDWAQGTEQVFATQRGLPCQHQECPDGDSPTECVAILPITLPTDERGMTYPAMAILRNYDRSLRPIAGKVEEGETHREAIRREMLEEALTSKSAAASIAEVTAVLTPSTATS